MSLLSISTVLLSISTHVASESQHVCRQGESHSCIPLNNLIRGVAGDFFQKPDRHPLQCTKIHNRRGLTCAIDEVFTKNDVNLPDYLKQFNKEYVFRERNINPKSVERLIIDKEKNGIDQSLLTKHKQNKGFFQFADTFPNIEKLTFVDDRLTFVPHFVGFFNHLVELDMSRTALAVFPKIMKNSPKLRHLRIEGTPAFFKLIANSSMLSQKPWSIAGFPYIDQLKQDVKKYKETTKKRCRVPSCVETLTKTHKKFIKDKQFCFLDCLAKSGIFTYEKAIGINGLTVDHLPSSLCKLKAVEVIQVKNSNIESIPDCFYSFSNLRTLDLSNTKVTDINPIICNLEHLHTLDITNTPFAIHTLYEGNEMFTNCNKPTILTIMQSYINTFATVENTRLENKIETEKLIDSQRLTIENLQISQEQQFALAALISLTSMATCFILSLEKCYNKSA